jgi:two-component system, NarL family, nitrate/nitrite response regulator NarL
MDDGPMNKAIGSHASLQACPAQQPVRVLLFCGCLLVAEALARVLCHSGMHAAVSKLAEGAPETLRISCPDVLLVDANCHHEALFATLRDTYPNAKIVVFGIDAIGQSIISYATAGVSGFVSADASLADLVAAIESAKCGELNCTPRIAGKLLEHIQLLAARERRAGRCDVLTAREQEIAALMGRGLSNKQIARSLSVQDNTVKNHVHSILAKLGVQRRGEVIARMHNGITAHQDEGLVPSELLD